MRNRLGLLVLFVLLVTPVLAACERDRPAPTAAPAATAPAGRGTVAPTPQPPAAQTKVALPTQAGQTPGVAATPAPLGQASPTPPPPKPLSPVNPTPSAGTPGPEEYFTYRVQPGDTLGHIADRFGVSPEAILALNYLSDPNILVLGSELKIPGEAPPEYGGPSLYTVRVGDTLSSIAVRYGVTVSELLELNDISDPNQLTVGQQLRIPATASVPTAMPSRTYTVRTGDTLYSIAVSFGVTVWALQVANNISNPDRVYVGQVLKIP